MKKRKEPREGGQEGGKEKKEGKRKELVTTHEMLKK